MLAAVYHSALAPKLGAFPEQIRDSATDSLAYAQSISEQMGPQGLQLAGLAEAAFLQAMDQALVVMSTVLVLGAVFLIIWAPGRDGRQWAFLTRDSGRHRR